MEQFGFKSSIMPPKDCDGMAFNVESDQTTGSARFAQTYLSQYLDFLQMLKQATNYLDSIKSYLACQNKLVYDWFYILL